MKLYHLFDTETREFIGAACNSLGGCKLHYWAMRGQQELHADRNRWWREEKLGKQPVKADHKFDRQTRCVIVTIEVEPQALIPWDSGHLGFTASAGVHRDG